MIPVRMQFSDQYVWIYGANSPIVCKSDIVYIRLERMQDLFYEINKKNKYCCYEPDNFVFSASPC